jgi:hypothetical protein
MNARFQKGLHFSLQTILILLLFGFRAQGRVYVITDTTDSTRMGSLRGAIIDANRHGGKNTIILGQSGFHDFVGHRSNHVRNQQQQWIFHLTISGADEDAARTGDLDITRGDLTIIGANSDVTIDATGLGDRVFQVFPRARLTLEDLTITGGTAPGNNYGYIWAGEAGGAIYSAGTLSLGNCVITNSSSGGDGGGIYSSGPLTMNNSIVVGNSTGIGATGGSGGGIKNDGTCFLTDCVISENHSGPGDGPYDPAGAGGWGGNGGGIYNSGSIVLVNCRVNSNVSGQGGSGGDPSGTINGNPPGGWGGPGGSGAGIYNNGQMQLYASTIYSNLCGNGGNGDSSSRGGNAGAGGSGAGIFNAGKLSLNASTISQNLCGTGGMGGGGTFGGFLSIPPTIGGTGGGGGGIYNAGSLDLTSCTIVLNQTGVGGTGGNSRSFGDPPTNAATGGQGGDGGGILNTANGTVVMRNTLVAFDLANVGGAGGTNTDYYQSTGPIGNSGVDGIGSDLAGDFTSQGFNLISVADGSSGFVEGVNADQVGTVVSPIDPLIGPLQMNGGFTPTHALLPGSPAIDQGNSFLIHTDQCGRRRPYDFSSIPNASGGDGSDIGAFELEEE